jgi:hypothetical protein
MPKEPPGKALFGNIATIPGLKTGRGETTNLTTSRTEKTGILYGSGKV